MTVILACVSCFAAGVAVASAVFTYLLNRSNR